MAERIISKALCFDPFVGAKFVQPGRREYPRHYRIYCCFVLLVLGQVCVFLQERHLATIAYIKANTPTYTDRCLDANLDPFCQ